MSPQSTIAHYRITGKLGEGGMGAVYRAKDTKLNRDVAIKVIPDSFARDPDRMARFAREAQVLAALNHPNIAAIYGVEERALVMELVPGEPLAGPLPLEEALPIIHQLIDALEYAHEKGIVHRDLKPANINITPEGRVKVLDFGLAKAMTDDAPAGDPASSPTLTMRGTLAGMIMGTAAYMSPEQARGHTVDKRADIWAFGVVVYEMLTGRRLFDGPTVSDTLAAVLKEEPDWGPVPERLRRLVRTCLVRDARRRMRDIGDARLLLDEAPATPPPAIVPPTRARLPWAVAALATVIAGAALWVGLRPKPPEPRPVLRFAATVPVGSASNGIALSRDGSRMAFVGGPRSEIYVRMMNQLEATPLPGTESASFLCFSPDGQWISYVTGERASAGNHLNRIAVAGGPPQILADVSSVRSPPGQDWGQDDNILFTSEGMLHRIPSGGGKAETIATPDASKGEGNYTLPQLLPGGREVLFTMGSRTAVLDLQTRQKKILLERNGYGKYAPAEPGSATGHILYYAANTGSLMAVPFDVNRLEVKGSPIPVLDGVQGVVGPFGAFGFSDSGTLAYVRGAPGAGLKTLVWVDRQGTEQPVSAPPRAYRSLRLSPKGERVALEIGESIDATQRADIWTYDLNRGGLSRITSENRNFSPVWTPDGTRLIYASGGNNNNIVLLSAPADGSTPAHPVSESALLFVGSVSPNGKLVIGRNRPNPGGSGNDFWVLPLTEASSAPAKPGSFLDARFTKYNPQFSPDGRWLAYDSTDTGSRQIYVVPYPGPGGKWPVSTDGGTLPRWASSGRELFYTDGRKIMAVEIQTSPNFRAGTPKLLFKRNSPVAVATEAMYSTFDVSPDGKRVLMLKPEAAPTAQTDQLHVVVNWSEELRRRAPLGGK